MRYSFANDDLQSENHLGDDLQFLPSGARTNFLGNPTQKTYDVNLSGGGALVQNRLWVNGTIRRWVVNKLTNAKNLDGTQALDDNTLKNYSGKAVASFDAEPEAVGVVPLEQQDPRPPPRHAAGQRPRHRRAGPDQPGADDAGEVHRHPQPAGVRVDRSASWTGRPTTATSPARRSTRSASRTARCRPPTSRRRATRSSRTRGTSSTTSSPTAKSAQAANTASRPASSGRGCTTSRATPCRATTT